VQLYLGVLIRRVSDGRGNRRVDGAHTWKTSGVVSKDVIRLRGTDAAWLVRDGMTVGEFLAGVPERRAGLKMLLRCHRARAIDFEAGPG
jgi:hypothetical protein